MAHDVFVSYSSYDKATADAVCALLESRGIRCWIAPRDILPGVSWAEAIIDAIAESRVMVLVFSAKANSSQQIQREVERAVHNGVAIVPLRIEDAKPSKTMEYFISTPHWLDALSPPLESHIQRLADALRTLLSRPDTREQVALSAQMRASYQVGPGTGEHQIPARPPTAEVPALTPPPGPGTGTWPQPQAVRPPTAEVQAPTIRPVESPGPATWPQPPPTQAAVTAEARPAPKSGGLSGLQLGAAAAAALVVVAVVVGLLMRGSSAPPAEPTAAAGTAATPGASTAAPTTPGSAGTPAAAGALAAVTVDAAPWARVAIAPLGGGTAAPAGELVTPLSLQLAPGEYDVTLENGGVTQPMKQRVRVAANQPNAFRFTMPEFDPAKVVRDLRAREVSR
jgi:hypothetical protein